MSLICHSRSENQRTIWLRIILASLGVVALLAARNAPPDFAKAPSVYAALSSASRHDQRPRFDRDRLGWSVPAESILPVPVVVTFAPTKSVPQRLFTLQYEGFHYNRPPPAR